MIGYGPVLTFLKQGFLSELAEAVGQIEQMLYQ